MCLYFSSLVIRKLTLPGGGTTTHPETLLQHFFIFNDWETLLNLSRPYKLNCMRQILKAQNMSVVMTQEISANHEILKRFLKCVE